MRKKSTTMRSTMKKTIKKRQLLKKKISWSVKAKQLLKLTLSSKLSTLSCSKTVKNWLLLSAVGSGWNRSVTLRILFSWLNSLNLEARKRRPKIRMKAKKKRKSSKSTILTIRNISRLLLRLVTILRLTTRFLTMLKNVLRPWLKRNSKANTQLNSTSKFWLKWLNKCLLRIRS